LRDLLLLAILLGLTPLILRAPIVGLVTWIWIALMNPQREVFGFMSTIGLNYIVAVFTILVWIVSKERKIAPVNLTTLSLLAFAGWCCVTTYLAFDVPRSTPLLERTLKTVVLAVVVLTLVNTKSRIQAVIWAIAVGLGYFGVTGGGFFILTAGRYRVQGPDNSMIADNNHLGLALVMLLPLINYLRVSSADRRVRLGCLLAMGLTLVAILGTYSRGALVALAAAGAYYAFRSRAGIVALAIAVIMVVSLPSVMPKEWLSRMASIGSAEQDASFQGRLQTWRKSWNIAVARPLTGGGFSSVENEQVSKTFDPYWTPDSKALASHSIYFQVMSDHGFLGLAIYLVLIGSAWLSTTYAIITSRGRAGLAWANNLGRMLQVSIVAFVVGGAGLSMAYYDGFLLIVCLCSALAVAVRLPLSEQTRLARRTQVAVAG
jgi:putative inorganic carbon (hco3(-)) transporter